MRTDSRKLWIRIPIATLALGAIAGGVFLVSSVNETHGAAGDFCGEIDHALACHEVKDRCLVAYHQDVTNQLAKTKAVMEFNENTIRLNDLDQIYTAGKELLASNLLTTAPAEYEEKRAAFIRECFASFP